jgi:hypothetical protein
VGPAVGDVEVRDGDADGDDVGTTEGAREEGAEVGEEVGATVTVKLFGLTATVTLLAQSCPRVAAGIAF